MTSNGSCLNPQYLQGSNSTLSVTAFDVAPDAILDLQELTHFSMIDPGRSIRCALGVSTLSTSRLSRLDQYHHRPAPHRIG